MQETYDVHDPRPAREPLSFPLVRLRKVRTDRHITQKEISISLGCTPQFYSQVERGVNNLSYEMAYKLAIYFGMTPDELFYEDFNRHRARIYHRKDYFED